MYKRLIEGIVEEKAKQMEMQRQKIANQRRMEIAKFDTGELFVGNLSRIITTKFKGRVCFKQLTDSKPRIFRHTALNTFQDIETEKFYPLIIDGQVPDGYKHCILEASLQGFESFCMEAIEDKQIDCDNKLTKLQLRQILDNQTRMDQNRFNI